MKEWGKYQLGELTTQLPGLMWELMYWDHFRNEIKNEDGDATVKIIKTFAILWTDLISRGVMVDLLYSADTEGVLRSLRKVTASITKI